MPIHIAAPVSACCSSRFGRRVAVPLVAANEDSGTALQDPLVVTALTHFAAHGLGAAWDARQRADAALLAGEPEVSRHWHAISSLLGARAIS